ARHRAPAPQLFARIGAVGRHVAALLELRTRLPDEDAAIGDARGAGDGQPFRRIGGLNFPDLLAGPRIDCDQAAIERPPDHLALPNTDATIDDAAAELHGKA